MDVKDAICRSRGLSQDWFSLRLCASDRCICSLAGGGLLVFILALIGLCSPTNTLAAGNGKGNGNDAEGASGEPAMVIVISPHNVSIRQEFGRGFAAWHQRKFGQGAKIEWRDLGGTADALRFVQSEFSAKPDGIGIDVFFGGGPEPYLLLEDKKLTQPYKLSPEVLEGIPKAINGVELYNARYSWYGAALSSFGILQNTRAQTIMGLPRASRWEDLAKPELYGWVGAGDPRNSGTMNNMFEAFLQAYGWQKGWELLTAIAGNVSKFDRLSSTTAKEVCLGEAAYGFAIDFYGLAQIASAGKTNMTFILPEDFTSISIDGICVLKGAPHSRTAGRLLDFIMGEEGQKLWFLPRGHPEGAQNYSIERMAVRPDFYKRYKDISNVTFSPFELNQSFHYDSKLARKRREVVAALAGALLVDTHSELRAAWHEMIRRGSAAALRKDLGTMPVTEEEAAKLAGDPWKDPGFRNRLKLEWQTWAQTKYRRMVVELSTGRLANDTPARAR